MRIVLACLLLVGGGLPGFAAAPPAASGEVQKLIADLADEDAAVRRAAARKLADMGEEVVPALRQAARRFPDVDARLRALVVARSIHEKYWGLLKAVGPGATLKVRPPYGGYWFNRVQFSRDGKYAVTAGGALILFDLESGKETARVLEIGGARPALAVAGDGKHVLTGHANAPDFHLLELPSLKTVQTFKGHTGGLAAVALSPDGKVAASAGGDATLRLWDVATGRQRSWLTPFTGAPVRLAFSADGKHLLVGTYSTLPAAAVLWLFDVEKGKPIRSFHGPRQQVAGLAFLPGGREIIAVDTAGTLFVLGLRSGEVLRTMKHGAAANDLAVSPDGRRALTAGFGDARVKLWELGTGRLLESFDGHLGGVLGVAFSPDGRRALSCDTVATVRVWKLGR